ncbi:MAG: hypothetical protein MUP66_02775 [Candidatus Nanohaloarchaeota archaeon QJJ-5]|nr:hypothetical protein [Candidatus Nanohaloarchaeota archaeon QJJ-5]
MVGTSFFKAREGKCPNCGTFGQPEDELDLPSNECPVCNTIFNKYIVFQEGEDIDLKNN